MTDSKSHDELGILGPLCDMADMVFFSFLFFTYLNPFALFSLSLFCSHIGSRLGSESESHTYKAGLDIIRILRILRIINN